MYNNDDNKRKILMDEFKTILERLDEHKKAGLIDELEKYCIITSMRDVLKLIAKGKKKVVEEANKIMGGEILEYEARNIYNKGIADGIEQGNENREQIDIKKMSKHGLANDKISEILEISVAKVEAALASPESTESVQY